MIAQRGRKLEENWEDKWRLVKCTCVCLKLGQNGCAPKAAGMCCLSIMESLFTLPWQGVRCKKANKVLRVIVLLPPEKFLHPCSKCVLPLLCSFPLRLGTLPLSVHSVVSTVFLNPVVLCLLLRGHFSYRLHSWGGKEPRMPPLVWCCENDKLFESERCTANKQMP